MLTSSSGYSDAQESVRTMPRAMQFRASDSDYCSITNVCKSFYLLDLQVPI